MGARHRKWGRSMDIKAYLERGQEAVRDGELELASQYFNSVLKEAPDHPSALEGLESVKVAQARQGWGPIGRWLVFSWCRLLLLMGKPAKALPKLRILHASNPTNQLFAETFARVAAKEDCADEAVAAYRTVLKLEPERSSALQGLGAVLQEQDKIADAIKCYQKLRKQRPDDDKLAHLLRDLMAKDYAQTGVPEDIKAARREMEKEKSKRIRVPGTPDFTIRLEKLAEHCEKNPDDLDARVEMAKHLRTGGQAKLAQNVLSELLDEHPDHWEGRYQQADLWREVGDLDLAVSLLGQLVKERPDDDELRCLWLETGIEKEKQDGRPATHPEVQGIRKELFQRRRTLWDTHLIAHPEDIEVRYKLAQMLLDFGETTEAIEHTQRLVQTPSWMSKGFLLLGKCFREQDKRQLAIEQFKKSIEAAKNRGYTHIPGEDLKAANYWLGVSYEEMGHLDDARDAYGQVYAADIGYEDIRERYERVTR